MPYDQELENRIFSYRAGRRAVVVGNLPFRTKTDQIEAIIKNTLGDQAFNGFFWPDSPRLMPDMGNMEAG